MASARVVAGLPLTGPAAPFGRDVLRGAELALEHAGDADVELEALDSYDEHDRDERAALNAERAVADPTVLAYLGDFHSSQVFGAAPALAAGGLLAVAPVATYVGLRGDTLVRIMPHDGVGARAIARWLVDAGVAEVLVVHDHDDGYGTPVGTMCAHAASEAGVTARQRPVWDHDEAWQDDLGDAGALLYVGVAGSGAAEMWCDLHAARPDMWLLGSEGVAEGRLAREMPPEAAQRTRFFVANRAPLALYGMEAMALILDAIAAGDGGRAAIVAAARGTRDRDSPIGRYSIDAEGHTTSTAYGRLAVVDGRLAWDV